MMMPSTFATLVLGLELYPWQVEAVDACAMGRRTALVAANGSGKTARVNVVLLLWFLYTYPQGVAMVTSGSWTQLETQLWPNLQQYAARFPSWTFLKTFHISTPEGGFIAAYSTREPGRAEGHHQQLPHRPLMLMVDEAKSVDDGIFDALNRCTPTYLVYTSSPGQPQGAFYEACHRLRGTLFHFVRATAFDCPHILKTDRVAIARAQYGPDYEAHPVYRSMILAEFSEGDDAVLIPPALLDRVLRAQPEFREGETYAAVDWAAGGDETVVAMRRGNALSILRATRERDTMRAAAQVVGLLRMHGIAEDDAIGDASGLGLPIIQACAVHHGYTMQEFRGGEKSSDPEHYANLNAEAWLLLRQDMEKGLVCFPDGLDREAREQLTTRRLEWTDKGALKCEKKADMAARGIHSPDRADALVMAWWHGRYMSYRDEGGRRPIAVAAPGYIGLEF